MSKLSVFFLLFPEVGWFFRYLYFTWVFIFLTSFYIPLHKIQISTRCTCIFKTGSEKENSDKCSDMNDAEPGNTVDDERQIQLALYKNFFNFEYISELLLSLDVNQYF